MSVLDGYSVNHDQSIRLRFIYAGLDRTSGSMSLCYPAFAFDDWHGAGRRLLHRWPANALYRGLCQSGVLESPRYQLTRVVLTAWFSKLTSHMFNFCLKTRRQRINQRNRVERLSPLLDWKNLGLEYSKARQLALRRAYPDAFSEWDDFEITSSVERPSFSGPASPRFRTGLVTPGDIGTLTEEVRLLCLAIHLNGWEFYLVWKMQKLETSDYRGGQWPGFSKEEEEEGYPLYVSTTLVCLCERWWCDIALLWWKYVREEVRLSCQAQPPPLWTDNRRTWVRKTSKRQTRHFRTAWTILLNERFCFIFMSLTPHGHVIGIRWRFCPVSK